MAEKNETKQPTHRAYSVIRRDGKTTSGSIWGWYFPHKDESGFTIMLQALPLDGRIVCRGISDEQETSSQEPQQPERRGRSGRR